MEIKRIRNDFPLLKNSDLAYLDNAATSQKPECVIKALRDYYEIDNANPYRGFYDLSVRATEGYESARDTVRKFIGASSNKEIIFTRNTTESINLLAWSFSSGILKPGDEILISKAEHHSNMIPWMKAAERTGATLKYIDVGIDGLITAAAVKEALTDKTVLLAITHVSNVFGRKNDIKAFAEVCHDNGTLIAVDGAQSVPHMPVDVSELDVDFLSFSGHKMMGPMGIGVLYGKEAILEKLPVFLTGGEMIETVSLDRVTYNELPYRFEAGTVNCGGAAGLKAAIEYIENTGFSDIMEREKELTVKLIEGLKNIPHITVLGAEDPKDHCGIATFKVDGVHPHDISEIFASDNIAVRAGHHCAEPLHKAVGIPSTARASVMFYNTEEEIDRFLETAGRIRSEMGYGK